MARATVARGAAALAITALAVTGCTAGGGGQTGADGDDTTLTFLTFETPNLDAEYWDTAIANASAEVPGVTIERLTAPTADRTGYARQLASSGQLPDILASINPSGFAESGQLAPWSEEQLANYSFPDSNPIGGEIYQLPYNTQPTPLVYYNVDLFEAAGITEPPTTYQELLDDSADLQAAGTTPFVVGGGGQDTFASGYPLIASVGAEVYAEDPEWLSQRVAGDVSFTDENFVHAVSNIETLASEGYIDTAGLSRSYAETEQAFRDGLGAMYPMGSWFAASADADAPDFEVGVFAWPSEDGRGIVPAYTGGGLSVSSSAPDVELAQRWAQAFMENTDNLDASVRADGSIIAIDGYEPPADMGPVYNATVEVYNEAVAAGNVVNAFTVETGDQALPPGVSDLVFADTVELLSGQRDAASFSSLLDEQFTDAQSR